MTESRTHSGVAIGNDIVDLNDSDATGIIDNKRFIARVFTAQEQKLIFGCGEPERILWAIWACKESAYKAMRRINAGTIFCHKNFAVDPDLSMVAYEDYHLDCRVIFYPDMILAWAITGGLLQQTENRFASLEVNSQVGASDSGSAAVRKLICSMAAETFAVAPAAIHVEKAHSKSAPVLMYDNRILSEAISLSHHGRYVAASLYRS